MRAIYWYVQFRLLSGCFFSLEKGGPNIIVSRLELGGTDRTPQRKAFLL